MEKWYRVGQVAGDYRVSRKISKQSTTETADQYGIQVATQKTITPPNAASGTAFSTCSDILLYVDFKPNHMIIRNKCIADHKDHILPTSHLLIPLVRSTFSHANYYACLIPPFRISMCAQPASIRCKSSTTVT